MMMNQQPQQQDEHQQLRKRRNTQQTATTTTTSISTNSRKEKDDHDDDDDTKMNQNRIAAIYNESGKSSRNNNDCRYHHQYHPSSTSSSPTTMRSLLLLYVSLCLFRLFMSHTMIHSYFDPDEFWQTLEPSYCQVFHPHPNPSNYHYHHDSRHHPSNNNDNPFACDGITWEWTVRGDGTNVTSDTTSTTDTSTGSTLRPLQPAPPSQQQQIQYYYYHRFQQWLQQSYIANGPIRSYLGLVPTIFYYKLVRYVSTLLLLQHRVDVHATIVSFLISRGPMYLHTCIITVPIDICTYYLVAIVLYQQMNTRSSGISKSSSSTMTTLRSTDNASFGAWYLFITTTSWFVSYAFTRTFANTYETLLFVMAVVLVSPELFYYYHPINDDDDDDHTGTDRINKQQKQQPKSSSLSSSSSTTTASISYNDDAYRSYRTGLAFVLGGCSIAIRITAVASFVPLGVLLAIRRCEQYQNQSDMSTITTRTSMPLSLKQLYHFLQYLVHPCATFGTIGILLASLCDYYYNGFFSIPIVSNLYFNVVMDYASLYGSHPYYYWYYLNGLLTMSGLCYPILIYALLNDTFQWIQYLRQRPNSRSSAQTTSKTMTTTPTTTSNQKEVRLQNVVELKNRLILWILLVSYIHVVSLNDHKEFRYISPILPLVFIICTPHVRDLFHWIGTIAKSTSTALGQQHSRQNHDGLRRRTIVWYVFAMVWIVANLVAVAYLGLFHQSGPITVNRTIVALATATTKAALDDATTTSANASDTLVQSIHYLTGACHSTPLQSHLHVPRTSDNSNSNVFRERRNVQFHTWHMNCHPSCRVEMKRTGGLTKCETDQFDSNPIEFLRRAYCLDDHNVHKRGEAQDTAQKKLTNCRTPPDYMVTFSRYMTEEIMAILSEEPFHLLIVDRYPNHLHGVQVHVLGKTYQFGEGWISTVADVNQRNTGENQNQLSRQNRDNGDMVEKNSHDSMVFGYQTILPDLLDIHWDAVVLLVRPKVPGSIDVSR